MTRRALAVAALVGAVLALVPAAPAAAHASLESSTPAANSVLSASPDAVILDFDEKVEAALADITLYDGARTAVELADPEPGADATQVRAAVPPLADGLYAVVWRVTSVDGHSVAGSFAFQIGTAPAGDADALLASVGEGGDSTSLAWRYGAARLLSIVGLVACLGLGWWALQRPAFLLGQRRVRAAVTWGTGLFVIGSLGAFLFFAAQVRTGTLGAAVSPSAWADATHTWTGRMLLARAVLSLGWLAAARWMLRRTTPEALALQSGAPRPWGGRVGVVAGLGALVTVATFSASGHANAVSPRWAWVAVDSLHLAAIVAWLGGLIVLLLAGEAARATPEVQGLALRFSGVATVAVPAVVATGVAQTWRLAGGFADVTATTWGRLLLAKATIVVAVIAVAGVSRWLLHREGVASIARTLVLESVAALVILGLAAAMVAQPPRPALASRPYEGALTASGVIASVSLSPGRVGSNEVHILITPPGGAIAPVSGATVRVSLPSAGVPASPATLIDEGPNHFSGVVSFTQPGDWTFELIVQLSDNQTVLLKTTVPIP